jgi:hypothetical protein
MINQQPVVCRQLIKSKGCKAGLVFNPATSLDYAKYVLDKIDIILLMSVNPGFGGQSFIPTTLEKLKVARKMIDESGYDIRLEVRTALCRLCCSHLCLCGLVWPCGLLVLVIVSGLVNDSGVCVCVGGGVMAGLLGYWIAGCCCARSDRTERLRVRINPLAPAYLSHTHYTQS